MDEPNNFTFFVYDKSIEKWWACSKNALDKVEELRRELEEFCLHNCSVKKGIEKFVKGGGKLEISRYKLEIANVFYGEDEKSGQRIKSVGFEDYVKPSN